MSDASAEIGDSRSMHEAVRLLDQITPADRPRAGAKAHTCARLKQAGFPVPDGLVVLTTATSAHLAAIQAHPWFEGLPAGAEFAVRSSGIAEDGRGDTFAGVHQTLLSVRREDLAGAIAECRASARFPRALEYRRARRIPSDPVEMGVLVQRMVDPVAAGVCFTVNPVSGADQEIVINSSWGVADALVSGQLDPDEFILRKGDGDLIWSRLGQKGAPEGGPAAPSLSTVQLRELSRLALAIERYDGSPQDIEWCHDGKAFWVVQSRPVTFAMYDPNETEWSRANLAEVLPDLTCPQALAAFEDLLNRAERQYLGRLSAPAELGPMVKSFCGRLHFNLSQLRHVCRLGAIPPALMLQSMGHAGAMRPSDGQAPRPSLAQLRLAPTLLRMAWRHARARRLLADHRRTTAVFLQRLTGSDPAELPDAEVWAAIEEWYARAPGHMQVVLLLANVLFHEMPVRRACDRVGHSFERLVFPQLAAGERSVSAQQAFDLVELADVARRDEVVVRALSADPIDGRSFRSALAGRAFLVRFDRFLEQYGHRGRYEYDWSLPRYREDPSTLLGVLRAHVRDAGPADRRADLGRPEREAADAWQAFVARLSAWQRLTTLPRVRRSIRRVKQYYVWREQVRSDVARLIDGLRAWHLVLADRFVARGWIEDRDDYFFLEFAEIGPVVRGAGDSSLLREVVRWRRAEHERNRSITMPLLMRASQLHALIRTAGLTGGAIGDGELTGQTVSGGSVEAEVVVVRDPGDFGRMKRGAILVAPAADPSWTPLFTLASGVIVEVGGVLSHASTIAREYGLPALANVRHATRLLRTGERVRLDAYSGRVQRLEVTSEPPG